MGANLIPGAEVQPPRNAGVSFRLLVGRPLDPRFAEGRAYKSTVASFCPLTVVPCLGGLVGHYWTFKFT